MGEEFGADRAGRRIRLGARPDRRHQILHLGHAGLGHPDCADPARRTGVRDDESAFHRRAVQRRRPCGTLSRTGRRSRSARSTLCRPRRGRDVYDQPAVDERGGPQGFRQGRSTGAALALRRRLLRLLHAGRGPCRSRHRDRIEALRRHSAGADHHRRRRRDHDVGERPAAQRRPHRRGRRQPRARRRVAMLSS